MQNNIPRHIAVIPDGNRRWAEKRGLPRPMGHKEGAKRLRKLYEIRFHRVSGMISTPACPDVRLYMIYHVLQAGHMRPVSNP